MPSDAGLEFRIKKLDFLVIYSKKSTYSCVNLTGFFRISSPPLIPLLLVPLSTPAPSPPTLVTVSLSMLLPTLTTITASAAPPAPKTHPPKPATLRLLPLPFPLQNEV